MCQCANVFNVKLIVELLEYVLQDVTLFKFRYLTNLF